MPSNAPGIQVTPLEDRTFSHGGSVSIPTDGRIPPRRRILKVLFDLTFTATQPAAAQALQNGPSLHQLIGLIKMGTRVSIDGLGLAFLNWMKNGRELALAADIPATANGVFERRVQWELSFVDFSSRSPYDGALASELFTDPIDVNFAAASVFAATAPTLSAATLRTRVVHDAAQVDDEASSVVVPSSRIITSQDFSALSATLEKPGAWLYALAYRLAANDNGTVTSLQAGTVNVHADGATIVRAMRGQDLASLFNATRAAGARRRTTHATDPVPGESLTDAPGTGNGPGTTVTMEFLPLVWPTRDHYLSTGISLVEKSMQFDFTSGTFGAYKVAYELFSDIPEAKAQAAARRIVPGASVTGWRTKLANNSGGVPTAALKRWGKFAPQRGFLRK